MVKKREMRDTRQYPPKVCGIGHSSSCTFAAMREALVGLWELILVIVGGGFVILCLLDFPFANREEPKYYWERDDWRPAQGPKYPPPPD
jgi:hypothetical protein